jgi:hypothetical protein
MSMYSRRPRRRRKVFSLRAALRGSRRSGGGMGKAREVSCTKYSDLMVRSHNTARSHIVIISVIIIMVIILIASPVGVVEEVLPRQELVEQAPGVKRKWS